MSSRRSLSALSDVLLSARCAGARHDRSSERAVPLAGRGRAHLLLTSRRLVPLRDRPESIRISSAYIAAALDTKYPGHHAQDAYARETPLAEFRRMLRAPSASKAGALTLKLAASEYSVALSMRRLSPPDALPRDGAYLGGPDAQFS